MESKFAGTIQRKQRKKSTETRESILDAAEDVFNEKGYSKTSLDAIAQAAGMTRGAIYWHFKDKKDLFNEMCERVRKPMQELLKKVITGSVEKSIEQLRRTHDCIMQEVVNNSHYRKVIEILLLKCEHTSDAVHILQNRREWRDFTSNLLRNALENAKQQGELPEDLDVVMAVDMMFSSFWGMISDWLVSPERYPEILQYAKRRHQAMFDLFRYSPRLKKRR